MLPQVANVCKITIIQWKCMNVECINAECMNVECMLARTHAMARDARDNTHNGKTRQMHIYIYIHI